LLGVVGGSGFYSFLDDIEEVTLDTPWGAPSAPLAIGTVGSRRVAFLPRHGRQHEHPPAAVPFRANVWALREVGVTRIFGPCAVGSLQGRVAPGHVVVCDQLVDRTWCRPDTFYKGQATQHVSFADPYCPELRGIAIDACRRHGVDVHETGTVVVIQGPRFSTRAESRWYASQGFDVVNMTQYPEAYLARELGLCYATLAMVTDYDAGHQEHAPVTMDEVLRVFELNLERLREILFTALASVPDERACCASELPPPVA
jgi:5'-methylthioadenosine phosphorylase